MNPLNYLLNIIYPPRCICCDCLMDFRSEICICDTCRGKLPEIGKHCEICSYPIDIVFGEEICPVCRAHGRTFRACTSGFKYKGGIREAILGLKFKNRIDYASTMAQIMVGQLVKRYGEKFPFELVTAVPISRIRLKERSYNQAELIAREISRILKIPHNFKAIARPHDKIRQSRLTAKQRRQNIKGSFEVRNPEIFSNKGILLVDDVATTGATLDETSKVLLKSGAREIHCVVFAITVPE